MRQNVSIINGGRRDCCSKDLNRNCRSSTAVDKQVHCFICKNDTALKKVRKFCKIWRLLTIQVFRDATIRYGVVHQKTCIFGWGLPLNVIWIRKLLEVTNEIMQIVYFHKKNVWHLTISSRFLVLALLTQARYDWCKMCSISLRIIRRHVNILIRANKKKKHIPLQKYVSRQK
jgi:hypothetical protein